MKRILFIIVLASNCFGQSELDARQMLSGITTSSGVVLSNTVKSLVIPITGNYTISSSDTNGMRTTNIIFAVNTDGGNATFTFPPTFVNTFKVLNVGTNWVINTASSGLTFLTYPTNRTITFGATLNNKYAGKVQEFSMLNSTNYVVTSDFRPLINIIDDATNVVVLAILTRTNFISGQRYTNGTGRILTASMTVHLTNAAVLGVAQMDMVISGIRTNTFSSSSLLTSLAGYSRGMLSDIINTNEVFWFTNTSTGVGNGATPVSGSGIMFAP